MVSWFSARAWSWYASAFLTETIEDHLENTLQSTRQATTEVKKAMKTQKKSRKKMCCLLFVVLSLIGVDLHANVCIQLQVVWTSLQSLQQGIALLLEAHGLRIFASSLPPYPHAPLPHYECSCMYPHTDALHSVFIDSGK